MFFLDDDDLKLVCKHRGDHMRAGFALQLVTVRWLGKFLEDPLEVPDGVLEFVAGKQLGMAELAEVKRYTERGHTRFDHQWESKKERGYREFDHAEDEFARWAAARSRATGDGPKAIFTDGLAWLRERSILLPGVTTLARLVASVRDETTRQLLEELAALPDPVQRRALDRLLEVPPGSRLSDLERWRKGPAPRGSGPSLVKSLDRVAEISGVGLARLGAEARVPPRRMAELSRYGMTASASLIRRHGDARRLATLVATVRHLEGKSIDDALELLDLLMTTELLGRAQRDADKENARRHPRLARASARLAVAVEALFESDGWGGPGEEPRVSEVWKAIEAVVSRTELRAALELVTESVPAPGGPDPDDWRAALPARYPAVSGFLKMLPAVIEFGASAEGAPVLAAMRALPDVLAHRSRLPAPLIPGRLTDAGVVNGPWRRLVFGHPAHEDGAVNRHAYAFCVLEQFWRGLKRRDIWADASTRWRNPQARLLEGAAWAAARDDVLTSLTLPGDPAALLAEHSRTLDAAYREVGGRLAVNTEVAVDDDGKIHLTGLKAVEEPPSLVDLRARTTAMLPRVDLPEVLLEVMSWAPEMGEAFTAASGGRSRLEDLPVSIAACLAAHALNVGYRPIAKKGAPALERSRLSHVFQNYVRPETLAAANAPLVARQAGLPLAQAWGGGMVAAVDGMRFVVPVPAAFARPNKKYFGSKRGMTWLNAMNDCGMGRGAKIVSGTVRDSLHMIDVIFGLDSGPLPEIVVTDTGSYSDVVFGLLELLDISYRPALADLPDQKGWRISASANYGPLNTFARGRIDTAKIRRNWEDILRVVASIYTGTVRAYDVVTMLQRDGHPTALGEAIAMYGRIFKTLHILSYIDTDETYRRDIKGIRNLQEGRQALARKICHGKKGELYHRYERGLENQLGSLGLVLNSVVLWTTVYLDAAVRQLRAQGYPVLEEDMARLSPFASRHLGVHGAYSFVLPDLARGAIRELRDPDTADEDDELAPGGRSAARRRGRRSGFFIMGAQHAQHGGRGGMLAFLLAGGDDQPGSDVTQAQLLAAQVEGDGEHGLVCDGGAADRLAAGAGRLVAFQGAVADVLALHPRQRGQHGEHDPGRVVRALQLAGQELQPDTGGAQLFGQRGQLDAAAEPFVLVHDDRDRHAGCPHLAGEGHGLAELGPGDGAGGDLLGEDPGDARRAQRVGLGVQGLADGGGASVPDPHAPAGRASAAGGRGSSVHGEPGLRSGGTGTLSAFASCGTSRNRAVWYWAATLPRPVRHGDPAGAAQEDIGQPFASTRRKSSSLTRRSFHGGVSSARPYATTRETRFALAGIWWQGCFTDPRL